MRWRTSGGRITSCEAPHQGPRPTGGAFLMGLRAQLYCHAARREVGSAHWASRRIVPQAPMDALDVLLVDRTASAHTLRTCTSPRDRSCNLNNRSCVWQPYRGLRRLRPLTALYVVVYAAAASTPHHQIAPLALHRHRHSPQSPGTILPSNPQMHVLGSPRPTGHWCDCWVYMQCQLTCSRVSRHFFFA